MSKFALLLPLVLLAGCNYKDPKAEDAKPVAAEPTADTVTAAPTMPANTAVAYDIPAATAYTMKCDLNSVSGTGLNPGVASDISKSGTVLLNGWLATEKLEVPSQIIVVLKGASSYGIAGVSGAARPDVAEGLGSQSVANAGFVFEEANISAVPAGQYAVHIVAPAEGLGCDTTKLVNVVE